MEEFDKLKELDIECKSLSERMTEIHNETRNIINGIDLNNRCFIIGKGNNYEVWVKYLNRVPCVLQEEEKESRYTGLEYNVIKITKYSNSDGTNEYSISNTTDYICADKLLNEVTEEEFNKYFTNACTEISNLLD